MLEILPIREKSAQEAICLKCGIDYDSDAMSYGAYIDGEIIGICQFTVKADAGRLIDLSCIKGTNDTNALFLIGRAVLNFIDLCGVQSVICESDYIDESLLNSIGFNRNQNDILEYRF